MKNIEVEFFSNDGQIVVGGVFFSLSKIDENIRKKQCQITIMDNNKILEEIAEFAYQIFAVFNNKYEATPIKVQKIIFISEMVCRYRFDQSILPSNVEYECNGCGFRIPSFDEKLKDFISVGELKNETIKPTNEELNQINEVIARFTERDIISTRYLRIISNAIIQFGRYYPSEIGEILNDFKKNSKNKLFDKKPPFQFNSEDFNTLLNDIENIVGENVIANFIVNYER